MSIRQIQVSDAEQLSAIYNHYIQNTVVTFEEIAVSDEEMRLRIEKNLNAGLPWLVVEENKVIKGYAYASKWNERSAYRFTVETSVYLSPEMMGKGMGCRLYQELMKRLQVLNIRNVIGVIALPNGPSVGLHEAFGFRQIGEFSDVGFKFWKWISVGYWQLTLGVDNPNSI